MLAKWTNQILHWLEMVEQELQQRLLAEYNQQIGTYQDLATTAASLLAQMLQGEGVQLHSITNRCKSSKSLAGKLAIPEKSYNQLSEITDLAAVRITTYFAEDVDRVAAVVEKEFDIDEADSTDKRKLLDPDRFGYQSLHYVASVTTDRCRLVEYSRFKEKRLEIQIRSILQHAWAEIEHDLGYKSADGVPREIRRRFSRIAGLLELADDEFSAIRRELDAYTYAVPREILEQPENVGVDKISLRALLSSENSYVRRLSTFIAEAANANVAPDDDAGLERNLRNIKAIGISTIRELEDSAESHQNDVKEFAKLWIGESRYLTMPAGVGTLYLTYVVLAERNDKTLILDFVTSAQLGGDPDKEALVNRILSTYKSAVNS